MDKTTELKTLLKNAHLRVKLYVSALELENAKLQRQISKLEANQMSLQNRIKGQQKEFKKHGSLDLEERLRHARVNVKVTKYA